MNLQSLFINRKTSPLQTDPSIPLDTQTQNDSADSLRNLERILTIMQQRIGVSKEITQIPMIKNQYVYHLVLLDLHVDTTVL